VGRVGGVENTLGTSMEWSATFEFIGKATSAIAALAGAWWAYEKWRKRDEHFPRVYFEVSVNFIGHSQGALVAELVASLENKGVVPLRIRDFTFKLLGLKRTDPLVAGPEEIRGQLKFPHVVAEGFFVPSTWDFTFIYPGVKSEYNFVCSIPDEFAFIRMQGDFSYLAPGKSHHAAKVLEVPNPSVEARPNGKAPGPAPGVVNHPSAGPGASPSVPPHLER